MNLKHGDVFRANVDPRHMWVALFDAARQDDSLLLVNLTTLREGCVDDACILEPEDFPQFIKHKTTVAYSRAQGDGKRSQFVAAVGQRLFCSLGALPPDTLKKVVAGALVSDELRPKWKSLLPPIEGTNPRKP